MGIFDGFLLVSDFDGTLAASDGNISEKVKSSIKYFISEGGKFTVCTGRSKQGFHKFEPDIINLPVILANGGMIYDYRCEKTVEYSGIDADCTKLLEEICGRFPETSVEMYSYANNTFTYNMSEESRLHIERQLINYERIGSLSDAEFPIVKLMLYVGKKNTYEVQEFLRTACTGQVKYIPTDGEFIELLNKNTDKGRAILRLAEIIGINRNRIFCVGDGCNDTDMLKTARLGFVPENGDSFAKSVPGTVKVCSNDDGAVSEVIAYLENTEY